ncbi:MAG: glycoside hydrolase family 13 protein [Austwickia sp.]|nr:glycoside hydrolase family 13 protein [Austwickia sp.]
MRLRQPLAHSGVVSTLIHPADAPDAPWWRQAVIYQIYPRSFADADGDGLGDLAGIIGRLPFIAALGVDGIWLSPCYPSPQADAGYDVADYRAVDPRFGSLTDMETLIADAHRLGLKVLLDLVPNHSSDEHAWFVEALAAGPESPQRDRYHFARGRGPDGQEPPNNWVSVFGGPAWTQVEPGWWYLHLFDSRQPDFNWDNEQVRAEFVDVLRFWLDRGVDGFRVDVAHGLIKAEGLPDADPEVIAITPDDPRFDASIPMPCWDQDGVHEVYRGWRAVLDQYDVQEACGGRILCAEAWVEPLERAVSYVRPDEMHQAFAFPFLEAPWRAVDVRAVIESMLRGYGSVGAPVTWVLSNHDVVRHATRLGYPPAPVRPNSGIRPQDPQPDAALGLRRARAASALMLALPGSAYLYQGEELGLPEHTTLPPEVRQDPVWLRTRGESVGRDGCRVPLPWSGDAPGLGFSPTGATWLPQPDTYAALAADRQDGVPGSTLELYRTMLGWRRAAGLGRGSLAWLAHYPPGSEVLAFENAPDGGTPTVCLTNVGPTPVPRPDGELILATDELAPDGSVPTDVTVWVRADLG